MEEHTISKKKKDIRLNEQIDAAEVRLIGANGEQLGIVATVDALKQADEAGQDLVEVSSESTPPVCRIMDFGKLRYENSKKLQAAKKKQKQIQVKEVKFRPGTEVNDYQVKLRNLVRFLENGDKAKVTLRFRGREMAHQQLGLELLKRVEHDLIELAAVEQYPRLEGRQMVMILAPKR